MITLNFKKRKHRDIFSKDTHSHLPVVDDAVTHEPRWANIRNHAQRTISNIPVIAQSTIQYEDIVITEDNLHNFKLLFRGEKMAFIRYKDEGEGHFIVERLWVIDELRGIGIGSTLLNMLITIIHESNGKDLFLRAGGCWGGKCQSSHELLKQCIVQTDVSTVETTDENRRTFYIKNGFKTFETPEGDLYYRKI